MAIFADRLWPGMKVVFEERICVVLRTHIVSRYVDIQLPDKTTRRINFHRGTLIRELSLPLPKHMIESRERDKRLLEDARHKLKRIKEGGAKKHETQNKR